MPGLRSWRGKAILALSLLTWAGTPSATLGQPDREVIVMFRPGVVNLPAGADSGTVEQARIQSPATYSVMTEYGVESIRRGMPEFGPDRAYFVDGGGDTTWAPDFSRVYALRCPEWVDRDAMIADLFVQHDVIYAEPNGIAVLFGSGAPYPNDPLLRQGSQWAIWRSSSSPADSGRDIELPEAWLRSTGRDDHEVVIIDEGFDDSHLDLVGRVRSDAESAAGSNHGFMVAGIVGAWSDNGVGISGINWRAPLVSRRGPDYRDVPALAEMIVGLASEHPDIKA